MDQGVGERGGEGRSGEADAAQRLSGVAEEVGGGANIFADRAERKDE
jgi:hypothetical protein